MAITLFFASVVFQLIEDSQSFLGAADLVLDFAFIYCLFVCLLLVFAVFFIAVDLIIDLTLAVI